MKSQQLWLTSTLVGCLTFLAACDKTPTKEKVSEPDSTANPQTLSSTESSPETNPMPAKTVPNKNPLNDVSIPIYSQRVALKVPNTWLVDKQLLKIVYEGESNGQSVVQIMPPDQELDNWQDMIIVSAYQNAYREDGSNPKQIIAGLSEYISKNCDTQNYIGVEFPPINQNPLPNAGALIGCNTLSRVEAEGVLEQGDGEFSYYYSIQGANDLYVIQRSWHKNNDQSDWDVWKPEIEDWRTIINQTRIVD